MGHGSTFAFTLLIRGERLAARSLTLVLFRFADGQVIEQRGVWDSLSAMQQLGVVQVAG